MEEKLILNDGTEYEGYCLPDTDILILYIKGGQTITDVYPVLSDKKKTQIITYKNASGKEIPFTGYIHLVAIREEVDGTITANMKKQ